MAGDEKVLAEIDCIRRFHRLRDAAVLSEESRYEAWLEYKRAIMRRDQQRCCRCGVVRDEGDLAVRPSRSGPGDNRVAPDSLVCVCVFCEPGDLLSRTRRLGLPS